MRRFATSLFLVILASLIFYGGAGVNFVSYCCGVCEKEGVEALLEAKCCEIHGYDHSRDNLANNTVECCGCDYRNGKTKGVNMGLGVENSVKSGRESDLSVLRK